MRIIAGTLRGRAFSAVADTTRPTSDRVREAIFSALAARVDFANLDVLDLFSGSGAFAFECVSRGVARVVSVDSGEKAIAAYKKNATELGIETHVTVRKATLGRTPLKKIVSTQRFDLIFADPPYGDVEMMTALLVEIVSQQILAPNGLIVLECGKTLSPTFPPTTNVVREYVYGDTVVYLLEIS